jgi:hypothetical protein
MTTSSKKSSYDGRFPLRFLPVLPWLSGIEFDGRQEHGEGSWSGTVFGDSLARWGGDNDRKRLFLGYKLT